MTTRSALFCLITMLVLTAACTPASEPGPEAEPAAADAAMADAASSDDPLTGTWSGDWGPSADHRNPVTLELNWDGTSLSGTVNPGPDAIALDTATFDPATGNLMLEANATNRNGEEVRYTIEGQIEGDSITGSWTHDGAAGDFTITKS